MFFKEKVLDNSTNSNYFNLFGNINKNNNDYINSSSYNNYAVDNNYGLINNSNSINPLYNQMPYYNSQLSKPHPLGLNSINSNYTSMNKGLNQNDNYFPNTSYFTENQLLYNHNHDNYNNLGNELIGEYTDKNLTKNLLNNVISQNKNDNNQKKEENSEKSVLKQTVKSAKKLVIPLKTNNIKQIPIYFQVKSEKAKKLEPEKDLIKSESSCQNNNSASHTRSIKNNKIVFVHAKNKLKKIKTKIASAISKELNEVNNIEDLNDFGEQPDDEEIGMMAINDSNNSEGNFDDNVDSKNEDDTDEQGNGSKLYLTNY